MLETPNLQKPFFPGTPNEVRALRGMDLDLPEGCVAAIIGKNGSGKSTLLNEEDMRHDFQQELPGSIFRIIPSLSCQV